jgi:hypothetical protein
MRHPVVCLAVAAGLAIAVPAAPTTAVELKFMTGPQGGSWIPLGGQLKDLWEKGMPGLTVQQSPGAGIANVRGIAASAIRSQPWMRLPAARHSISPMPMCATSRRFIRSITNSL